MKRLLYLFLPACSILLSLTSCDGSIYDDTSSCRQTSCIRFYNETPCDAGEQHPERLEDMRFVDVYLFDLSGKLAAHYDGKNARPLCCKKEIVIPTPPPGRYRVVFWGMSDRSAYVTEGVMPGQSIEQMFLSLKPTLNPLKIKLPDLWYGKIDVFESVDRKHTGAHTDSLSVNMLRYTNNLNLRIKGLNQAKYYTATITDDNAAYDFRGRSAGRKQVYTRPLSAAKDFTAAFSLLKLEREPKQPQLSISNAEGAVIYSEDLISIIDAAAKYGGADLINLLCEHEFDIALTLEEKEGTYMLVSVTVNGWNVIVRDVILGQ